ncbi:MAG: hypothetical protein ACJ8R9_18050 [Steroidobacteraceae bacterium]
MSEHKATISWKRTSEDFLKGKYSREHTWTFEQCFIANSIKTEVVVNPIKPGA